MRWIFLIVPALLLAAPCSKCELNRAEMRCNYYVAKEGDVSKASFCKEYAEYLDSTKVYGKAAWYYLLGLEPQKALEAAKKAVEMGEGYAWEYMGDAYLILGDKAAAKEAYGEFKKAVENRAFFTSRSFGILEKLYESFDAEEAKRLME